jgi:hypothetical protein
MQVGRIIFCVARAVGKQELKRIARLTIPMAAADETGRLFTADHSFALLPRPGKPSKAILFTCHRDKARGF